MKFKLVKNMLKGELLKRKNFSLKDSIFIISSPRGGSTWLGEIFNELPNTVINWEPFHPEYGVLSKKIKRGDAIFIPEKKEDKDFYRNVVNILNFKKHTNFTLSFCTLKKVIQSKIVITKSVRTTCLIPWIVKHISLGRKPVYLLRHPIATSFSHLKAFDASDMPIEVYKAPDVVHNERFQEHEIYFNTLKTKIEKQVAIWCINNLSVINHPDHGKKWLVSYYEDLVLYPKEETEKLFRALGFLGVSKVIEKINFRKPSQTDMKQDLINNEMKQLKKWQAWLNEEELTKIQNIFDYFGLKIYSAYKVLPLK